MKVIANDAFSEGAPIMIEFFDGQQVTIYIETRDFNELLNKSDFITLHVPVQDRYVIGGRAQKNEDRVWGLSMQHEVE